MKFKSAEKCDMLGCLNTATKLAMVDSEGRIFQRQICDYHAAKVFQNPEEYGIVVKEIVDLESYSAR